MIVEWDVPFTLQPTDESLPPLGFNQLVSVGSTDLGYFLLDSATCQAGSARRITRQNIAQADGEIKRRKFKTGYVIELNVQLWERSGAEGEPACGGVARRMADLLDQYLEAVANNDGELVWQPSPYPVGAGDPPKRMLAQARSMGPSGDGSAGATFVSVVVQKDSDLPLYSVTFALLSPLPYAVDQPLTTTDITAGATITNDGNAAYYPVLRVQNVSERAPDPLSWDYLTGFTVTNESVVDELGNSLKIIYDATLPGASHIAPSDYVEMDLFLNTIELGGVDPAADYIAGIDARNSDFWMLAPGDNNLVVSGVTGGADALVEVDWRAAWI